MKLKLERPLAVFDLETTGLDVSKDRIVEIAIIKVHTDGSTDEYLKRINPEMLISEESTSIHGISNEDIKDASTFTELANEIAEFIGDADLAGYNSNKFDIPVLAEEFLRAGHPIDLSQRKFIDVQNIFHKMEQRTLVAAYAFYCNKDLSNAHNAMYDTRATWEVLQAQLERYETLEPTVSHLSDFTKVGASDILDFAGRIARNDKGETIYNFGKHKGKTIREVMKVEPGYYGWMLDANFPLYTKQVLQREMDIIKKENEANKEKAKSEPSAAPKKPYNKPKEEDNLSLEEKLKALQNKFK